jgi:hypothetical protein
MSQYIATPVSKTHRHNRAPDGLQKSAMRSYRHPHWLCTGSLLPLVWLRHTFCLVGAGPVRIARGVCRNCARIRYDLRCALRVTGLGCLTRIYCKKYIFVYIRAYILAVYTQVIFRIYASKHSYRYYPRTRGPAVFC